MCMVHDHSNTLCVPLVVTVEHNAFNDASHFPCALYVHRQTSSRSSSWRRMSYSRPPSPSPGRLPLPVSSSASPAARATGGPGRAPRRHPSPCCWPGAPRVRCVWWCVCPCHRIIFFFLFQTKSDTTHVGVKVEFKKGKKIQKITLFVCFFQIIHLYFIAWNKYLITDQPAGTLAL